MSHPDRSPQVDVPVPSLREITDPAVVKAMGHPLRMQILTVLDRHTASPRQLAEQLGERLGTISYHVRTLADLGLVELVDSQPRRGAVEHYYRAASRWVVSDETWGQLPRVVRQELTRGVLDQVAVDLCGSGFDSPRDHLSRTLLQFDEQGRAELAEELRELLTRVHQIAERSRHRADPELLNEAEVVLMSFRPSS